MTDKEYKLLMEKDFDNSQINQIIKLTKILDVTFLLDYIDNNIETSLLRDLNRVLNKKHYIIDDDEMDILLKLLEYGINPSLCLDPDLSSIKRNCIIDIYKLKIEEDSIKTPLLRSKVDYVKCAEVISYPYIDNDTAITYLSYIQKGVDVSKFARKDFNIEQLDFAKKLFENGFEKYIDKIKELNVNSVKLGLVKKIDELGLDFVKYINLYPEQDLRIVLLNKADGIDLDNYLKNQPYPKKAVLCEVLVKKKLAEQTIKKLLNEIPYDLPYSLRIMYDDIINAKLNGLDVEKIFDDFPKKELLRLAIILKNEGYSNSEIKNGLNYINKNMVDDHFITAYDYHKLFDLYNEGIDISNLLKTGTSAKRIDTLLDIANKSGIDKNKIFANNFIAYEIDFMKFCLEYNKKSLIDAIINVKYPDEMTYYNIKKMILSHSFPRFDYSKLLFDKGNDVFKDYKECFEFSEGQKFLLSSMLRDGYINLFDLENLRDAKIDEEELLEINKKLEKGENLNNILNKKNIFNVNR